MSAQTIARWNAIPLSRPEGDEGASSLKRPHDDDSDDDMSIVSRTPSPGPEGMNVDSESLSRYDEYHGGMAREVITVETKIKPTNKGFAMLAKMGWVEGKPVGLSGDGRVEPIPFAIKNDQTGLGKMTQDAEMIETTVSQRRGLDSERQRKETEEQRRVREDNVARQVALKDEISTTLRAFYCALCDKQFKNVAQYDEHTNSYAHHHKAREKDLRAAMKLGQAPNDARKEKERRREEKELRKIAAAAGIKMPKPAAGAAPPPALVAVDAQPEEAKKLGWGAVVAAPPPAPSGGQSDWASLAPSSDPLRASGGWATVNAPPPPAPSGLPPPAAPPPEAAPLHTPAFRSSGWTSLDTTNHQQSPMPPSAPGPAPPPSSAPLASAPPSRGGWSAVAPPSFAPLPVEPERHPPAPAPGTTTGRGGWATVGAPPTAPPVVEAQLPPTADTLAPASIVTPPTVRPARPPPGPAREEKRQGWQQFRQGKGRR